MATSLRWCFARTLPALLITAACESGDRPVAPGTRPEFAISDAVHEGGRSGFYFLPPMVAQPTFSGTFDADITGLNPAIAICDITNGLDNNCGGARGTPAVVVFTTTSTPAITVDLSTPQYQVNWDTQGAGFVAGHTYRLHVTATTACGGRRELGFADVLLTTTAGQVKQLATGDIIVLQDGRTLPIHSRIETAAVGDCWTSKAPMPTARFIAAAGVINDALFVAGGGNVNNCTPLQTLEAYDPVADAWATKAPMPTARWNLAAGVVSGILYTVGGQTGCGGQVNTVEAYNPAANAWASKAPMPTARWGMDVGVVNGILYSVGGYDGSALSTVEAYDPASDTWTTEASMPTARVQLSVAVVNGILYAIGGGTLAGVVGTVEAYDPVANTWTTKASMPTPRQAMAAGVVNGIIYVAGGVNNSGTLNTAEAYDPVANTWTTKASMPTARASLSAGVVRTTLYAVGGESQTTPFMATNEAYTP